MAQSHELPRTNYIEVTQMFFARGSRYDSLWLGHTWEQIGAALQKAFKNKLIEDRNSISRVRVFLQTRGEYNETAVRAWRISSLNNIVLAEVRSSKGYQRLGWFRV